MLFVGESPPANGGYFYFGKGILFASTKRAFIQAFCKSFTLPEEFFRYFQSSGCFLDDLSSVPVYHLPSVERKQVLIGCIDAFAERLRDLKPDTIIVFLNRIRSPVERAVSLANIPVTKLLYLPFPGYGHQKKYVDPLAEFLERTKASDERPFEQDFATY